MYNDFFSLFSHFLKKYKDKELTGENKMSNEALKPCPFCGGKPYIVDDKDLGEYEIGCNNRRCKVVVYTDNISKKKRVIATWNKRTKETQ